MRSPEDYDDKFSTVKNDFLRKWHHNRSAKPISLEEMMEETIMTNEVYSGLPDVMTAEQLVSASQISKSGAYALLNSSDFPTFRIGGRKMVMKKALLNWLKEAKTEPAKPQTPDLFSLLQCGQIHPSSQEVSAPEKLTPAMLNDLVKAVYVHASDNSSGHRVQDVEISYNYIGILPATLLYDLQNGKTA